MAVGYLADAVHIGHRSVGIAEGLDDNGLRVRTERLLHGFEVAGIYDGGSNALRRKRVLDEVERAAIEVVGSDDVVAVLCDVLQGIGNGCCTGGHGQSCHTSLKGSYAVFENTLGGVGQTAIDVACIAQSETVGGMLCVMEHITGGLVDGHGA